MENTQTPNELAERLLIERAKRGDTEAFDALVRRHYRRILCISLRLLRNEADAADNVQTVFWKAYENLAQFRGRSRFSTWLVRIALNEALMMIRQRRRERLLCVESESEGVRSEVAALCDGRPDPERWFLAKELAAKASWGLSPSLVEMFIRNQTEGWTQRELAGEIGVSLAAMKSRIFHAKHRMQEQLQAV